jgi:hypothetical protein
LLTSKSGKDRLLQWHSETMLLQFLSMVALLGTRNDKLLQMSMIGSKNFPSLSNLTEILPKDASNV